MNIPKRVLSNVHSAETENPMNIFVSSNKNNINIWKTKIIGKLVRNFFIIVMAVNSNKSTITKLSINVLCVRM